MARLLQGGKASSCSLGNTDEDCLCNPDLSPADTNTGFNYLLTDWCHLTTFNFCWGLHELLFRISFQLPYSFPACNIYSTLSSLHTEHRWNYWSPHVLSFQVFQLLYLQLDPERDRGILPNLLVSGSQLSLYNPT